LSIKGLQGHFREPSRGVAFFMIKSALQRPEREVWRVHNSMRDKHLRPIAVKCANLPGKSCALGVRASGSLLQIPINVTYR